MESLLQVGVIASTHGIKGEVKVFPTTDDVKRFKILKEIILNTGIEELKLEIQSVKFLKKFVILKFAGYDKIEEIEKYKGKSLYVTREQAVPLEANEYFVADLIGMQVMLEDETVFGRLKDVMETGANDVYIIETKEGQEVLVPAIHQCILNVDVERGQMTIHLLDGLL